MVMVSYNDALAYCNCLGKQFGGDWRLPTEAQWEFAARGGNKSHNYIYIGSDKIDKVAWHIDNAGEKTQMVGGKKPNELGIYDMRATHWIGAAIGMANIPPLSRPTPKALLVEPTVFCAAAAPNILP